MVSIAHPLSTYAFRLREVDKSGPHLFMPNHLNSLCAACDGKRNAPLHITDDEDTRRVHERVERGDA